MRSNLRLKFVSAVQAVLRFANAISTYTGRVLVWLPAAMVVGMSALVGARYAFQLSSAWSQEIVVYMHCLLISGAMGYTLSEQGHVRLDLLRHKMSVRSKAVIDLVTALFFIFPCCYWLTYLSWDYVLASWSIKETSPEAGGLPFVYLQKSLLILLPAGLAVATVEMIAKAILQLMNEE